MAEEGIIDWQKEATGVIKDVESHVKKIQISNSLVTDGSCVFINLTTIEDKNFTILLDKSGFKVVSFKIDTCDEEEESNETHESINTLLEQHSPGYIKSFGNSLISKLEKIQQ